jgi:hypothetical protein
MKLRVGLVCLLLCGASARTLQAAPVELLTNGSFEAGAFTGWTASVDGVPFLPWSIDPAGVGAAAEYGMAPTAPQSGVLDAWNGFDGTASTEFNLYQDVAIPASASSVTLSWMYRAQWNYALVGAATQPRVFDVTLRDPTTNAVLQTVYSFSTGTVIQIGDTGWFTRSADLSWAAGSTVRIFFRETIPETYTGPGQFEIDGVSVMADNVPEPSSLLLVVAGLGSVLRRVRNGHRRS